MRTLFLVLALAHPQPSPFQTVDHYLETYLRTFPTRATEAGRHDWDGQLENLSSRSLAQWLSFNRETLKEISAILARGDVGWEDRLDLELLQRRVGEEIFGLSVLARPERDPLFWTGILGNATVFLLVREDRPLSERLASAESRAAKIPRLVEDARQALARGDRKAISPDLTRLAAAKARATREFYLKGFPSLFSGEELPRAPAGIAGGGKSPGALRRLPGSARPASERLATLGGSLRGGTSPRDGHLRRTGEDSSAGGKRPRSEEG